MYEGGPALTQALIRFATEADVGKPELRAGLNAAGVLVIERLMNLRLRQEVAEGDRKVIGILQVSGILFTEFVNPLR